MSQEYLSITSLTKYLKKKFDVDPYLERVFVVGEVSNFRLRTGHQYFSLKDENAKIKAICFQHIFNKLGFIPEEGTKVLAIGRVSLFENTGEYQLYIEKMELSGTGALFKAFKELQEKLTKEGIFNQPKKKIPKFPKTIAIVTSQSGAVIQDIKTTIKRRYPIVNLHIYDTVVQGKDSASSIVNSLKRIEESTYQYDTVIIARGGGSIEDLWSFNEESVVRAIFNCSIPVISSIGHETDTTLSDYVADLRAPTPTAAAEFSVPVLSEVVNFIDNRKNQINNLMLKHMKIYSQQLQRLMMSYIFRQPERLYESYLQKLDYINQSLLLKINQLQQNKLLNFSNNESMLYNVSPLLQIKKYSTLLNEWQYQLNFAIRQYMSDKQRYQDLLIQKLDLLSPLKNMTRGYSYIEHDGQVVSSVEHVAIGEHLRIKMVDGQVDVIVENVEKREL